MTSQKDTYKLANGVEIPCLGFGTWQTPDGETAIQSVRCALDAGYVHIDTAQVYGNEASVGKAIRLSGVPRKDLFITTNSYCMLPQQLSVLNPGWAAFDAPEVAEGIRAIRFAEDTEGAKAAWNDLQEFVYSYGAAIAIGQFSDVLAYRTSVEGFDYAHYPVYWNVKVLDK